MGTSLVLLIALTLVPGQGGVALKNARSVTGEFGIERKDNKILPGDLFYLSFDITGIKPDADGNIPYEMSMEVFDAKKNPIFKQQPLKRNDPQPFGGGSLPARAFTYVGPNQEPGQYILKVTVKDPTNGSSDTLERTFEVLPKAFGIVSVYTAADPRGEIPAPRQGVVGQVPWLHYSLVGFERDKTTKYPKLNVEVITYNDKGQKLLPKPLTQDFEKEAGETDFVFPLRFAMPFNTPGKYVVEVKATDKIAGKTAKIAVPVTVLPQAD